jgi:hypothetical protein
MAIAANHSACNMLFRAQIFCEFPAIFSQF